MKRLASILLSLAFIACGSDGPTSLEEGGGPQVAASVEVIENDSLTVEVGGTSETVVAVLRDSADNPVDGGLSAWEIEGGKENECGFWESGSVQSGSDGEVTNFLNAGEVAWTAVGSVPDCRYRVIDASEGAPEPVRDSVQVRVEPGPPDALAARQVMEDGTTDRQGGPDADALAQLTIVWDDSFDNPALYDAAVTSGPAEIVVATGAPEWTRSVRATGAAGTGGVEVWSLPDSSETLSGTFEVAKYGPDNGETWICLTLEEGSGDGTCDGPPDI